MVHRLKKLDFVAHRILNPFFENPIWDKIGPNPYVSVFAKWTNIARLLTKVVSLERCDRDGTIGAFLPHMDDIRNPIWCCFDLFIM